MKKFAAGFATAYFVLTYIERNQTKIDKVVKGWIAQLELKNDIIKHDNQEVGKYEHK